MNTEALRLKKTLQELEFSLVDVGLYLDSHPCCREALEYYESLLAKHNMVKEQFEAMGCPLTSFAAVGGECFTWVADPWPWEMEAN